ncbi:hypothetical protein [Synechococcus sp. CC9605]|uniref:hypothetical protein n=1 Tax=Synechococcus sp. (strain CC9605) TaxID=110662 RepID=UPI00005D55F7|nr:hypothetical protein [Synechococcus sp. CC9605]ABB33923.1 hypothetical protein Syncc9605_0147 [Synechococcus sp. CC9605]
MKALIIYPNKEWMNSGGARIRYKRLEPFIKAKNVELVYKPINKVSVKLLKEVNIAIIVKVYGLDSLRIISFCKSCGIGVGIDLFDDYFSDETLNLLHDKYNWIKIASIMCDFVICSTEKMKEIAAKFVPKKSIHLVKDTCESNILSEETEELISQKVNSWKASGHLNILWFGIGDNPYFEVGIKNLANYSNSLFQFRKSFGSITFTILTNERALTQENLSFISNLPIEANVELWSPQLEAKLLREAHVTIIPVSHQQFSIAKSSNRCITALSYGCQVLSNGYNLYSDFTDLIYRSTGELIHHYKHDTLKLNNDSLPGFIDKCNANYNPEAQADNTVRFFKKTLTVKHTVEQVQITAIHFNLDKQKLSADFPVDQFPIANAMRLSRSGFCNFGIEQYNNEYYIQFTDNCHAHIQTKWKEHLEKVHLSNITVLQLNIKKIKNLAPNIAKDVDRILKYRYREERLVSPRNHIRQRILFLFISKSLSSLLQEAFNCKYTYLTDLMTRYQVSGGRP